MYDVQFNIYRDMKTDSHPVIYIGARSQLLSDCINHLPEGKIISLNDAYNKSRSDQLCSAILVLFSLPETSDGLPEFLEFLAEVECHFLINISSTCVYAYRQYAKARHTPFYIRVKNSAHEICLNKSFASNIIVGTLSSSNVLASYPRSTRDTIVCSISKAVADARKNRSCEKDIIAFQLTLRPDSFLIRIFKLSYFIISNKFLLGAQLLDVLLKLCNFPLRGYTCLSSFFFAHTIRIGDGAFGSAIADSGDLVIRSNLPDSTLSSLHLNTLIGKSCLGLDSRRHGIEIISSPSGFKKKWNPSLRIRNPLRVLFNDPVVDVGWLEALSCFLLHTRSGRIFYCQRLKLAAGALENIRLCLKLIPKSDRIANLATVRLSDHFILHSGSISLSDAQRLDLVNTDPLRIFMVRKNIRLLSSLDNTIGFFEARYPIAEGRWISRIDRLFSLVFNRIGCGFARSRVDIYAQLLTHDSIRLTSGSTNPDSISPIDDPRLIDMRSSLANVCYRRLSTSCPSFLPSNNKILPSHHLHGGRSLLENSFISRLIRDDFLLIAGSPSIIPLGPFHHTLSLCRQLKAQQLK